MDTRHVGMSFPHGNQVGIKWVSSTIRITRAKDYTKNWEKILSTLRELSFNWRACVKLYCHVNNLEREAIAFM
jgi:hypothetical protein